MNDVETPTIWFRNICRKNGVNPTDHQVELMGKYASMLLSWNKKINLISRRDEDRVWPNHILHSISLLFKIGLASDSRVLDIGTGGGLPGIPLKILLPESEFLLVDSTRKKVMAVQDMIDELGLSGIAAMWGRVEELATSPNLKSHFDYIVSRAVAPMRDLVKWSIPFLRQHDLGKGIHLNSQSPQSAPALIALKGGSLEEEMSKIPDEAKVHSINVIPLVFHGSEEVLSTDKKIIVVHF